MIYLYEALFSSPGSRDYVWPYFSYKIELKVKKDVIYWPLPVYNRGTENEVSKLSRLIMIKKK